MTEMEKQVKGRSQLPIWPVFYYFWHLIAFLKNGKLQVLDWHSKRDKYLFAVDSNHEPAFVAPHNWKKNI